MKWHAHSFSVICPTVVFYGLAFAADKKSSRKIKYKKIPRVHKNQKEDFPYGRYTGEKSLPLLPKTHNAF